MLWRSRDKKIEDLKQTITFQAQEIEILKMQLAHLFQYHERILSRERAIQAYYAAEEARLTREVRDHPRTSS